jgi:hypothetical protein
MGAVAFLVTNGVAQADDKSHKAAAEQLLKVTDAEKLMERSIDVVLDQQLKANPQLAPAKEAMRKFFKKHLSYASIKDDMIKIYTEEFTEDELKKAVEFYSTPVGKKLAAKMPVLLQKGGELGMKRVQENAEELRQMIEEELNKK